MLRFLLSAVMLIGFCSSPGLFSAGLGSSDSDTVTRQAFDSVGLMNRSVGKFGVPPSGCWTQYFELPGISDLAWSVSYCSLGLLQGVVTGITDLPEALSAVYDQLTTVVVRDVKAIQAIWSIEERKELAKLGQKDLETFSRLYSVVSNALPNLTRYFSKELAGKPPHEQSQFLCQLIGKIGLDTLVVIAGDKGLDKLRLLAKEKNLINFAKATQPKNGLVTAVEKEVSGVSKLSVLVNEERLAQAVADLKAGRKTIYDIIHEDPTLSRYKKLGGRAEGDFDGVFHLDMNAEQVVIPRGPKYLKAFKKLVEADPKNGPGMLKLVARKTDLTSMRSPPYPDVIWHRPHYIYQYENEANFRTLEDFLNEVR